jgi:hypothetical protein
VAEQGVEKTGQDGLPPPGVVKIKIGPRPGKLTDGHILTWRVPGGQYWTMTGPVLAEMG